MVYAFSDQDLDRGKLLDVHPGGPCVGNCTPLWLSPLIWFRTSHSPGYRAFGACIITLSLHGCGLQVAAFTAVIGALEGWTSSVQACAWHKVNSPGVRGAPFHDSMEHFVVVHFMKGTVPEASEAGNPGLHAVEPRCESSAAVAFAFREGIPEHVRQILLDPSSAHALPCAQQLSQHPHLVDMYELAKRQPGSGDDELDDADEEGPAATVAKQAAAKLKKHITESEKTLRCGSRSNVYAAEIVKELHVTSTSHPTEVRFLLKVKSRRYVYTHPSGHPESLVKMGRRARGTLFEVHPGVPCVVNYIHS